MTDVEWCNQLEPKEISRGMTIKWRFYFLSLLRPLKMVDSNIATRAAHIAARQAGLYSS